MPRWTPLTAAVCMILIAACSGDDKPSPTLSPTGTPQPTPTPIVAALPAPVPFTLIPATAPEDLYPPRIYDLQTGLLEPSSAAYTAVRRAAATWRIELLDFGSDRRNQAPRPMRLGIYNPTTDAWQAFEIASPPRFEIGRQPEAIIASDGSRAAAQLPDGHLLLIDLKANTYSALPLKLWPREFSSDNARIIARLEDEPEDGGGFWVVVDFADPLRSARLPLGAATSPNEQWSPLWLDAKTVLTRTQNKTVLQIIDVGSAPPSITLEEPIPSDQIVLSADKSIMAVQERNETGTTTRGFPDYELAVKVYRLKPFKLIASLPGAAIGYQLEQPSRPPDDMRVLAVMDLCVKDKTRLVAFNLKDGSQTELARGKIMQYVFSPDGRWVAYTTWPGDAYIVPTDGSLPPVLATRDIAPPTPPVWSRDSRNVSFNSYFGGGDYCV